MSRFDRGPAGTPAAAPQAAPQAARPRLDVYDGDALVETIRLTEGSHCLGRDTDACDVALEHASCSRRHARLAVDARGGVPQSRAWAGGGVTVWGQLVRLPPGFEANGVPHWPPQPVRGVQGCPAAGGLTAMGSIRPTWFYEAT